MATFMHILLNMENVIFKSVDKTTLELHFQKMETTFYSSNFKVGETKVVPDFTIHLYKCNFQHFKMFMFSINKMRTAFTAPVC